MKRTRIVLIALASLTAGVMAQAQPGQYPPPQPGYPPSQQQPYPDQRYGQQPYDPSYDSYDNYVGDDYNDQYDNSSYDNNSRYSPVYDARSASIDLGIFYRELSPYGQWIRHPYYGWVWFPRSVGYDWRPYTVGRWVNSNYGWTWVSFEPFGWATYHYGRWAFDRRIGWIWVPGTVWGPAWVAWQQGSGYVGWAPLPPQVGFQGGLGIRIGGLNISLSLAPTTYSFVDERQFLESRLDRYVQPSARNITIIRNTRNITDYAWENDRLVNRGVPVERIEQITRRRVNRLEVVDSQTRSSEIGRDQVRVYRPAPEVLRSAPIAERNNAGVQLEPRHRERPNPAPPQQNAPSHVQPRSSGNTDFDRVQQAHQRELDRAAQENRKKLEEAQKQETRQRRDTGVQQQQLEQQHQVELKAEQDMQKRQQQQMRNRLQIERQAEVEKQKDQKGKQKDTRNRPDKKDKKDKGDDSPPPPRQ